MNVFGKFFRFFCKTSKVWTGPDMYHSDDDFLKSNAHLWKFWVAVLWKKVDEGLGQFFGEEGGNAMPIEIKERNERVMGDVEASAR